jgi:hypothetical protein
MIYPRKKDYSFVLLQSLAGKYFVFYPPRLNRSVTAIHRIGASRLVLSKYCAIAQACCAGCIPSKGRLDTFVRKKAKEGY